MIASSALLTSLAIYSAVSSHNQQIIIVKHTYIIGDILIGLITFRIPQCKKLSTTVHVCYCNFKVLWINFLSFVTCMLDLFSYS